MRRVADHGLVEVVDFDVDPTIAVGDRTQIAEVAIPQLQIGGPSGTAMLVSSSSYS